MKRILFSLIIVALVATTVGLGAMADWVDEEQGTICGQAGWFNLKIDTRVNGYDTWYDETGMQGGSEIPEFICEQNMEPGDCTEVTLSLHIFGDSTIDYGAVTITVEDLVDADNSVENPERSAGDTAGAAGELSQHMLVVIWADDGDNELEDGEEVLYSGTLKDLSEGTGITVNVDRESDEDSEVDYIGMKCCLPGYDQDPSIDIVMTDSLTGKIVFDAAAVHTP